MVLGFAMLLLSASGPKVEAPPPMSETAKLFFLAGDIAKAVDFAGRCLKREPKVCGPMLKALAEYGALANHTDTLSLEQARDFVKYDRAISPGTPGKLTEPVIERFVSEPLRRVELQAFRDPAAAIERVLIVDPSNAHALAAKARLRDAGR